MFEKNKSLKFGTILIISIFLTLGFSISLQSLLAAWTAPAANPPLNDISDLLIGGSLGVGVNAGIGGKIGIGTAITSTARMTMKATTSEEGLRIISSNYSPLAIRNTNDTGDLFRIDQTGSVSAGIVPWARLTNVPAGLADGDNVGILTELDPSTGTLNTSGNQWCKSDAAGVIQCNNAAPTITETDPQVGTLTNGKWCTSNGASVNCTSDVPSVLPSGTTAGYCYQSGPGSGSTVSCYPSAVKYPAICVATGTFLGNPTAIGVPCSCAVGYTKVMTGTTQQVNFQISASYYTCVKN